MSEERERKPGSPDERLDRLHRLLDELESHLDSGFFLSFIGKIVVDEKKICTTLNEMRSMLFAIKAKGPSGSKRVDEAHTEADRTQNEAVMPEIERGAPGETGVGADRYALQTLDNLEQTLQKVMNTVREGKKFVKQRMAQEVSEDGASEI